MTIQEYFGDWSKMIDLLEADKIIKKLSASNHIVYPKLKGIFKTFTLYPFDNLRLLIIGLNPYNTLRPVNCGISTVKIPIAKSLTFVNSPNIQKLSSSLEILKESVINYTFPHRTINFDPSLEKWESHGVLLLIPALSLEIGRESSHTLMWGLFIKSLLTNLSKYHTGTVYILIGTVAQSFELYINRQFNHVIHIRHPSWYARQKQRMLSDVKRLTPFL